MNGRPIEVGDRFEERDPRNAGRIVEVREVDDGIALVQNEVHPNNPTAVGRHSHVSFATLYSRFTRVSR